MVIADACQQPGCAAGLHPRPGDGAATTQQHSKEQRRLRVVAFAFLTPFFFLRGGLNVSLGAVFANLGLLAVLFAAKLVPKRRA